MVLDAKLCAALVEEAAQLLADPAVAEGRLHSQERFRQDFLWKIFDGSVSAFMPSQVSGPRHREWWVHVSRSDIQILKA